MRGLLVATHNVMQSKLYEEANYFYILHHSTVSCRYQEVRRKIQPKISRSVRLA
jgi:hypothetical protein